MTYESNQLAKYQGYVRLQESASLAHHGIKGQKWGLRRYQNEDGTLTEAGKKHYAANEGGNSKFDRKFKRDMKKMQKLGDRTDIELQRANAAKYKKRAIVSGTAAGALGVAAVGSHLKTVEGVKSDIKGWQAVWDNADRESSEVLDWQFKNAKYGGGGAWEHMARRGQKALNAMNNASAQKAALKNQASFGTAPVSLTTKLLIGGAAAAGGFAAYNAGKSIAAKRRTTPEGHAKAVAKAAAHMEKMKKTYGNTPYMQLFKSRIEAYKKEHPNTELSDKDIMKNLM